MVGPPRNNTKYGIFLLLFVLVVTCSSQAIAQERKVLKDYDFPAEHYSPFGESVLVQSEQGYKELILHARTLWNANNKALRIQALQELDNAAQGNSQKPLAYYWLGFYHFKSSQWSDCANALEHVFRIAPNFKPLASFGGSSTSLDLPLGTCYLYSGQYEKAIQHFKRVVVLQESTALVELRLGEAYMALGRLKEAIAILKRAVPSGRVDARYSLAVALDRAERTKEARQQMRHVLRYDSDLSMLSSTIVAYAPASDLHYYLALGNRARSMSQRSLYHFRLFIHKAPHSKWQRQAKRHIEDLGTPRIAEDLEISGTLLWKKKDLTKSIRKIEKPLQACVAHQPLLLLRLDIAKTKGGGTKKIQVRVTVIKATPVHSNVEDAETSTIPKPIRVAISCIEEIAKKMSTPDLMGPQGHASAHFTILGTK